MKHILPARYSNLSVVIGAQKVQNHLTGGAVRLPAACDFLSVIARGPGKAGDQCTMQY